MSIRKRQREIPFRARKPSISILSVRSSAASPSRQRADGGSGGPAAQALSANQTCALAGKETDVSRRTEGWGLEGWGRACQWAGVCRQRRDETERVGYRRWARCKRKWYGRRTLSSVHLFVGSTCHAHGMVSMGESKSLAPILTGENKC